MAVHEPFKGSVNYCLGSAWVQWEEMYLICNTLCRLISAPFFSYIAVRYWSGKMVPYWSCLLWYSSLCHIPSALELLESGIERVLSFAVAIHSQDSHYNTCSSSLIFLAGIVSPSVIRWPFYYSMHSGINRWALTLPEFAFAVYPYSFLVSTHTFWQSWGWCFEFIPVRHIWAMVSSFFALSDGSKKAEDELLYVESFAFLPTRTYQLVLKELSKV